MKQAHNKFGILFCDCHFCGTGIDLSSLKIAAVGDE